MTEPSTEPSDRERGPDEVFCRDCGAVISERAEICPACGVRQRPPPTSSTESAVEDLLEGGNPFVAAVLSALFPGLGQLYNRELERGLAFIIGGMTAAFSALVLVGFILYPLVWLFSIYDAYTRAEIRAAALAERRADATGATDGVDEGHEVGAADAADDPAGQDR